MKIYPGNHNVVTTEDVTVNHIPLSYFSSKESVISADIKINNSYYGQNIKEKLYPYQYFEKNTIALFDKDNNKVQSDTYLKRNGNLFFFEPKNSVEFIPQSFSYSVLLARQDSYKNNIQYDIKIGAHNLDLAEQLLGIFNSEVYAKPNNIIFNGNSLLPSALVNMSFSEPDFLFMDKIEFDSLTNNDLNSIIDSHTNLWISCDEFKDVLVKDENITTFILENPELYGTKIYSVQNDDAKYKFDLNVEIDRLPKSEWEYINLFIDKCPILILKKENGAFIIFSHSFLINNGVSNYRLIYEILIKIYLNSYFETKPRTSYIADFKIDYFIKIYQHFNKYHPDINLNRILYEDNFNDRISFNIINIKFDNQLNDNSRNRFSFQGTDKYNNLLFESLTRNDPEKGKGTISIFTSKDTIIYYNLDENELYTIEDNLDLSYQAIGGKDYLVIKPYRSSSKNINLIKEQYIEISDKEKYGLVFDRIENKFKLILYNGTISNNEYAAVIQLKVIEDLKCYDIRTIGGGESSSKLNYDMIDTGSLKGRPYRIGSTMIIKVPLRYRQYKENILAEIKKHMASADYPILIFE